VEPTLALFATGALYAASRWRSGGGTVWLAAAGFLAGSAAATKYLGLFFVAWIPLAALAACRSWKAARGLGVFAAAALLAAAPIYLCILHRTGNPLFPFFPELFGTSAWDPVAAAFPMPLEKPLQALTSPFDAVFRPRRVGWLPPLSPWWLPVIPALAWAARRRRGLAEPLLLSLVYGLGVPLHSRFWLPVLPALAVAAGRLAGCRPLLRAAESRFGGLAAEPVDDSSPAPRGRGPRRLAALVAALLLAPGWLYAVYRLVEDGLPPATAAARETYLARRFPLYPALRHLDEARGPRHRVYAAYAETMAYFSRGVMLGDWTGPASFKRVLAGASDAEELAARLRGVGADFLLVPRASRYRLPAALAGGALPFRLIYADAAAEIYEVR
jgi:hypothetical protein